MKRKIKHNQFRGFRSSIFLFLLLAIGTMACQPAEEVSEEKLLAKVYNKSLYLSELDGMFPEGTTSQDSSLTIQAYTNRWVREAILLYEAERNIPNDLNIDKLVRDYRASLIRHNYEQILVQKLLDSTIAQEELLDFYEQNKEQYQLETPIARCYFIKLPLPVNNESELRSWWQNPDDEENFKNLVDFVSVHAQAHHLVDSTWQRVEDIAIELPIGTLTVYNVSSKRDFILRDDNFLYFFKLFELKNKKEIAPLGFIQDQARKVILHRRKTKLLEEKKNDMLDLALERKNVEIFY
jgi:hypothetical protein